MIWLIEGSSSHLMARAYRYLIDPCDIPGPHYPDYPDSYIFLLHLLNKISKTKMGDIPIFHILQIPFGNSTQLWNIITSF